jgi:hypothetical protein
MSETAQPNPHEEAMNQAIEHAKQASQQNGNFMQEPLMGSEELRGKIDDESFGPGVKQDPYTWEYDQPVVSVRRNGENVNVRAVSGDKQTKTTDMDYKIEVDNGKEKGTKLPPTPKDGTWEIGKVYAAEKANNPIEPKVRVSRTNDRESYTHTFKNPDTARKFATLIAKQITRRTEVPKDKAA